MKNILYKINGGLDLNSSFKIAKNKQTNQLEDEKRLDDFITLNKFGDVSIALLFTNLTKIVLIMIIRSFTTELEAQNELWFLIGF